MYAGGPLPGGDGSLTKTDPNQVEVISGLD